MAPALAQEGHEVVFVAKDKEWHAPSAEGLRLLKYQLHRNPANEPEALHPYLRRFESAILEGQAVVRACQELVKEGWEPDWIINHVGFGNGLYLSDVFPDAKRIGLFEWYYNPVDSDVDFLTKGPLEIDRRLRLRTWNAQMLIELAACDYAVVPTKWQAKQFPEKFTSHVRVIHEGIDCERLAKLKGEKSAWPDVLPPRDKCEVLTYVARGFEEYRGFPQVMQTIAQLQKKRPNLHVLIVGSDTVAYGGSRKDGKSWKQWALNEFTFDASRTHWLGPLQEAQYHSVLAASDIHFYLTVPFVLSWSLLESMAAGCTIVASNTAPVQEVLINSESAMLVDFFNVKEQVMVLDSLFDDPTLRKRLAKAASLASKRYKFANGLAGWKQLLGVDTTTSVG